MPNLFLQRIMRSAGLQPPAAISEKAKIQPDSEPEIPQEPEQISFIPAAQRQSTNTNNLIGGQSSNKKGKARKDDSSDPEIVQVGATQGKKRKPNKRLAELSQKTEKTVPVLPTLHQWMINSPRMEVPRHLWKISRISIIHLCLIYWTRIWTLFKRKARGPGRNVKLEIRVKEQKVK
ncbi:hypothetical protein FRC02_009256 [Tulasnella sp. 418]|nr:hypothetical protein FRC02_009256 [Tulasnella sp. 418]